MIKINNNFVRDKEIVLSNYNFSERRFIFLEAGTKHIDNKVESLSSKDDKQKKEEMPKPEELAASTRVVEKAIGIDTGDTPPSPDKKERIKEKIEKAEMEAKASREFQIILAEDDFDRATNQSIIAFEYEQQTYDEMDTAQKNYSILLAQCYGQENISFDKIDRENKTGGGERIKGATLINNDPNLLSQMATAKAEYEKSLQSYFSARGALEFSLEDQKIADQNLRDSETAKILTPEEKYFESLKGYYDTDLKIERKTEITESPANTEADLANNEKDNKSEDFDKDAKNVTEVLTPEESEELVEARKSLQDARMKISTKLWSEFQEEFGSAMMTDEQADEILKKVAEDPDVMEAKQNLDKLLEDDEEISKINSDSIE